MRISSLILVATAFSGLGLAASNAMPGSPSLGHRAEAPFTAVQYVCTPNSCINPRTGAYTESGCNGRGCYPSSGIVGYVGRGRAQAYEPPRSRERYDDRYDRWDDDDDRPRRRRYYEERYRY